jgi:hypothetical protein
LDWLGLAISLAAKVMNMTLLNYYIWMPMKSFVYETILQMVAELMDHIFDATAQIRNDDAMLHRATSFLLRRMRTYL